jgi:ABC-2 type transport system ATP-binding protein
MIVHHEIVSSFNAAWTKLTIWGGRNGFTDMMIETQDLTKKFDDFLAVKQVDLQLKAGEVLALLGPNGAGKTTTVRMLTSILAPTSGWARVAGFDVVRQAKDVRASVGVLTEQHGLYSRMLADEYLDFFGQIYSLDAARRSARSKELLVRFGLYADRKRHIGEFSKGMRQKLALARAMLHEPPVLLLDEPTSAMDPESARLVRDSIHALRSAERAIIICTHNLAEAEELADQIAIIRCGHIIACGTPSALKAQLLGPAEFQIDFAESFEHQLPSLPAEITLTTQGPNWLRFSSSSPGKYNPLLLQILLSAGLPVMRLQEVPRSLEQVYLQAITASDEQEVVYAE